MKIIATLIDGYKVDTKIENHSYILDQKETSGGTDAGTSPINFLMASVLGCKVMVAKGFLNTREIAFEKLDAAIDFNMGGSNLRPTVEGTVTIRIVGAEMDEKSQKQIHQIVKTGCPVENLLDSNKAAFATKIEVN